MKGQSHYQRQFHVPSQRSRCCPLEVQPAVYSAYTRTPRALLITEHITSLIRCLGSVSLWHILKNSRQLTGKEDYGLESRVNPGKEHLRLIPSLLGTAAFRALHGLEMMSFLRQGKALPNSPLA